MAEMIEAHDLPRFKTDNYILVGPAGGGKSSLAATLPGKSLVSAFDVSAREAYMKWSSISKHITIMEYIMGKRDLTPYTHSDMKKEVRKNLRPMQGQQKESGNTYFEYAKDITKMVNDGTLPGKFKNYILDSGTSVLNAMLAAVLEKEGRPGQIPGMTDYTAQMKMFEKVCDSIFSLNMNVILILHEIVLQDEVTKKIINQLNLTGKSLKNNIPTKVGHLLRCFAKPSQGVTKFYIQTTPDTRSENIRTSFSNLNHQHDVTIEDESKPQLYGLGKILSEQQT